MQEVNFHNDYHNFLVVEDSPAIASVIVAMLQYSLPQHAQIARAGSLAEAISAIRSSNVQVILLDLSLPDSSGTETVMKIRQLTSAPIIVLTGHDDEQLALESLKAGAHDYLVKSELNARLLIRSVNYSIERQRSHLADAQALRLYEQREDFMTTLTHDLKNPLIGANRILELMTSGDFGQMPEQQKKLLMKLRDNNKGLLAMIQNLVDVYRYEKDLNSMIIENTDLREVIMNYLDSVAPLISDKKLMAELDCQTKETVISADSMSIYRVVQNLVENAIKFSPVGGVITIRIWKVEDTILFLVADKGPGIEPNDRGRLFQRFYQGRPGRSYRHGMGLGLYLCRQIVEAHKGSISCHSEENGGSTFTVSLPIVVAQPFRPPSTVLQ